MTFAIVIAMYRVANSPFEIATVSGLILIYLAVNAASYRSDFDLPDKWAIPAFFLLGLNILVDLAIGTIAVWKLMSVAL